MSGSITLLFQRPGQPGLEVLAQDSSWSSVPVYPPGEQPRLRLCLIKWLLDDYRDYLRSWLRISLQVGRLTVGPSTGTELDAFPPILVNVGDLLSYWTNGLLKSTVHRVVFPNGGGKDRYSIAYFCHPVDDAPLIAIPSEIVATEAGSNATVNTSGGHMTAAEHLKSRL